MNLDTLLDEIADRVAERLIGRLDRSSSAPLLFTTHKAGPLIPGKTRRWMLEHLKDMPGARKIGREWEISPADYEAWARAEDARRCALASAKKPVVPGPTKRKPVPSNDISYPETDEAELQRRVERSLQAQGQRRSR